MATDDTNRTEIPAGTEVEFINRPRDATTYLVEGLAGLAFSNGLVKVNLFEQIMENDSPGRMLGRFNVSLNIPTGQFLALETVFRRIADELSADLAEPKKES